MKKIDTRQAALPLNNGQALITEEVYVGVAVMEKVKAVLKSRRKSRAELTEYLSERLGRHVQVTTVDMWFSGDKAERWPSFPVLILICQFLDSLEPLQALISHLGADIIDERGKTLLRIGETYVDKRRLEVKQDELDRAVQSILFEEMRHGRADI